MTKRWIQHVDLDRADDDGANQTIDQRYSRLNPALVTGWKIFVLRAVPEKRWPSGPPQLFMLSMSGGEAFQFTSVPRGAGGPQWSPDGKMISFYNGATTEEIAKAARERVPPRLPKSRRKSKTRRA